MKIFTNRSKLKKIVIVTLTVMLLTFSVPKPVNAVAKDHLILSPVITFATFVVDSFQHILEWAMLGESSNFMQDINQYQGADNVKGSGYIKDLRNKEVIDGSFFGLDEANVPKIQYTPEEIFSNRVLGLDVNFITPSVKTADPDFDKTHNTAMILQPIIASWYVAIRTLSLVGLLSVLVYLGIRMLLTSVAADKAKYKKMMMDWLVALCLLFVLHYIMSFALTMSEVVTSMIADRNSESISVIFNYEGKEYSFSGNLMSYVRFMIQSADKGVGFYFLYLMLFIYTLKFTWAYIKRVINMAFLTLVAPAVALTYPIDKVGDGKAQAFDMWIKEFAFNALLQPLHLLLYTIILGSAMELAADNPLYAVVCLSFIFNAEKLFKKMFGFDKASAGTVGSIAGAAAVTTIATKALMGGAKMLMGGKGGEPGKVRTKDNYQREGKNDGPSSYGANGINSQNVGKTAQSLGDGEDRSSGGNNGRPLPHPGGDGQIGGNNETLSIDDQIAQEKANMTPQDYRESGMSPQEWEENRRAEIAEEQANNIQQNQTPQGSPATQEAMKNLGPEEPEGLFGRKGMLWADGSRAKNFVVSTGKNAIKSAKQMPKKVIKGFKKLGNVDTYKNLAHNANVGLGKGYKGFKAVAPQVAYKAVRGTAKMALRGAGALALGATAGVIGLTSEEGMDKGLSTAMAGAATGLALGGGAFERTIGQKMPDKSIKEAIGAAKYGSATDYRNAQSDKRFLKSDEFNEYYERYYKGKKTKKEVRDAFLSYRQAGITDKNTIRKAMKLEDKYIQNGADKEQARLDLQRVIQTKDQVSVKSFKGDAKAREADINMIEKDISGITDNKLRRERAEALFRVHQDFYEA